MTMAARVATRDEQRAAVQGVPVYRALNREHGDWLSEPMASRLVRCLLLIRDPHESAAQYRALVESRGIIRDEGRARPIFLPELLLALGYTSDRN